MSTEMLRDILQASAGDELLRALDGQRELARAAALAALHKADIETVRYQAGIIDGIGQCLNLIINIRKD